MNKRPVLKAVLGVLCAALVVALGVLLALRLFPTPQVAVIRVSGEIWSGYTALISQALDDAAQDPAIRAVVLEIASPGGEVTASESLYYDVLRLRETMPVIASVDEMAASGAYYLAAAAEQIYAKPASWVGNIGVIAYLPEADLIDEILFTTGPFKLSGGPQVETVRQMEMLKQSFLAAILAQREERLTVGTEVLSRGELYLGLQAQKMGLIDQIGSQAEAIEAAARLAGLRHWDVVDTSPEVPEQPSLFGLKTGGRTTAASLAEMPKDLPPGYYFRYVEPAQ